jgi:hypothetical protein
MPVFFYRLFVFPQVSMRYFLCYYLVTLPAKRYFSSPCRPYDGGKHQMEDVVPIYEYLYPKKLLFPTLYEGNHQNYYYCRSSFQQL